MKNKNLQNKILTVLTLVPLLVATFFIFYRNAELYIDLQWKVIEALGNTFLVFFIIFAVLLVLAQAVKLIFHKKDFSEKISQKVLFWLTVLEALFVGYMFLNNAGMDNVQAVYGRTVTILLLGLLVFFWFPKSKFGNNFFAKGLALVIALAVGLIPFLQAKNADGDTVLSFDPAVYVVEDNYQIIWHTETPSVGSVEVGGKLYEDIASGGLRCLEKVHKITLPMAELDAAGQYKITSQKVVREPYKVTYGKKLEKTYSFRPMDFSDGIQIYNISDNHSSLHPAAETASYWGDKLDLLILNGDIANDLMTEDDLLNLLELAAEVTKGSRPVLYARGNHETRGAYNEDVYKYVGSPSEGKFYFTARLGPLWLMVLDFAEDKADDHKEYYGLARYDGYREVQTKFIKSVIDNKEKEYEAPGVEYKLLVSHIRVNNKNNWHTETHKLWSEYANEIEPDLHLSGHSHRISYLPPAGESEYKPGDYYGDSGYAHNYTVVMGSKPPWERDDDESYIATAVEFKDGKTDLWFTDNNKNIVEHHKVK